MRLIPLITLAALVLLFAAAAIYAWCQGWYASAVLMVALAVLCWIGLVDTHAKMQALPTEEERLYHLRRGQDPSPD